MRLTEQQIKDYLASPNHCPSCGSSNIEADPLQLDDHVASCGVLCEDCGMIWRDIYSIVDIEEV